MTRLHSKAGYVHIVLKKEVRDRLDSLRVSTPYRVESRADVILRILDDIEGVNTRGKQQRVKVEGVHTLPKSVNTDKVRRDELKDLSLEDVVELKLAGKI